jgi:hypothetical protein
MGVHTGNGRKDNRARSGKFPGPFTSSRTFGLFYSARQYGTAGAGECGCGCQKEPVFEILKEAEFNGRIKSNEVLHCHELIRRGISNLTIRVGK